MNRDRILSELKAERDRLNTAVATLEKTNGNFSSSKRLGRRTMSLAARAKISAAQKLVGRNGTASARINTFKTGVSVMLCSLLIRHELPGRFPSISEKHYRKSPVFLRCWVS
jgi:hypothetical protein